MSKIVAVRPTTPSETHHEFSIEVYPFLRSVMAKMLEMNMCVKCVRLEGSAATSSICSQANIHYVMNCSNL